MIELALDAHSSILIESTSARESEKKAYIAKCVDDIKKVCVCVRARVCMQVYVCVHVRVRMWMHVCLYVRVYARMYMYVCVWE